MQVGSLVRETMDGNIGVILAWEHDGWLVNFPKYALGSAVMVRARAVTARLPHGGIVISTTEPIVSAAKGAKRYKILPFGKAEAVLCEERDLKVLRMPKKTLDISLT